MSRNLPSESIPESEKRRYSEADVHAKLFEPDMTSLGFPPRTASQADGEYFLEQGHLALRRLKSKRERGRFDGLYLIGNAPVALCELKRHDLLDSEREYEKAKQQLVDYARSEDFECPPPFLLLYSGKASQTAFFRLKAVVDTPAAAEYELLDEIWEWSRVKDAHLRGAFAEEVVTDERLLEILLYHLDRIEDDLRADVLHAVEIVSRDEPPALLTDFGQWLLNRPEALRHLRQLYERKVAEVGSEKQKQVAEEMITQAALNYLNKVFFLNLCEDRNLHGFYRILREFLPSARTETSPTTAAVFLALLRRRLLDTTGELSEEEENVYKSLRSELAPDISAHVIGQNSWRELIRVAFDLAEEQFPLVYREDAYDYFRPHKETLAELVYDLSTKSFRQLTNRHVGDIYQGLLSSRRCGAGGKSGRQLQQAKLGAFYTPHGDVDYMVSRLNLRRDSRVLDPCMGSGHFLEVLLQRLMALYTDEGFDQAQAYKEVVARQLFGADIDTFATSLSAIRLFLLDENATRAKPQLFVHDMLLHSQERPQRELFSEAERAVSVDPEVDEIASLDEIAFDAVVGNPPYGARKPAYKVPVYRRLYGSREADRRQGSSGTGDHDTYAMFFANGIERLREGGRLCLITNDSFRSLTTYSQLRRHILDRCKIVEILLTDTKHFQGVSFQFAGMAITTLEKCSDAEARAANVMRLVDYIRDPADFSSPPPEKVQELRQEEYEALAETPFFVGVPDEILASMKRSSQIKEVADGRQGLGTADDQRFLAGIGEAVPGLSRVIEEKEIATSLSEDEQKQGISVREPHWIPFAKGEGYSPYWRESRIAIDWSKDSVTELRRRANFAPRTPRRPRLQNEEYYFTPGITYPDVGSGPLSARLLPAGWIFSHKGSAIFTRSGEASELFVLAYLNSALATYFMKKVVNTTATASLGYVEKLPYR